MKRYSSVLLGVALVVAGAGRVSAQTTPVSPADGVKEIKTIAAASACAGYSWLHRRGEAPRSYMIGTALVFARAVCQPDRSDTKVVSAPVNASYPDDALYFYRDKFARASMSNSVAGKETLRHSYALLIGLGMMESSGKHCEGRDTSECFVKPGNAEAGLYQTSYDVRSKSPALDDLINKYTADRSGCMLDVFEGNFTCPIRRSSNRHCPDETSDIAGTGPGADWQRLTKSCPAFATEYGAVVLRMHGGKEGEFGPLRKRQVELRSECDAMLRKVQVFVEKNPNVCSAL
jgi:hypothetical protein